MLKLRMQGTKEEIKEFSGLLDGDPRIEVIQRSDIYSNKGTTKYFRMYADIIQKEFKGDKRYE